MNPDNQKIGGLLMESKSQQGFTPRQKVLLLLIRFIYGLSGSLLIVPAFGRWQASGFQLDNPAMLFTAFAALLLLMAFSGFHQAIAKQHSDIADFILSGFLLLGIIFLGAVFYWVFRVP
ncbi:MAG: hypothetical protein NZN28_14530 [Meiothermus sp.]|uniref:hypothetical protein n=1 Tax=Meiothermus sp. TaxID=1955249 RepID=UPI0025F49CB5|nr:hypothetical protein [Meiothermus sp.]MCS7069826.1 hypothetical protein [Meiothermus sp.]